MKKQVMYTSYLLCYTFFYHGLYYCPFISNKFNKLITIMHGK